MTSKLESVRLHYMDGKENFSLFLTTKHDFEDIETLIGGKIIDIFDNANSRGDFFLKVKKSNGEMKDVVFPTKNVLFYEKTYKS